jgi:hypothetical protein
LFSLKHYVTLGRFGLSCLGPLVLLFSLKHYVTLGCFGLEKNKTKGPKQDSPKRHKDT